MMMKDPSRTPLRGAEQAATLSHLLPVEATETHDLRAANGDIITVPGTSAQEIRASAEFMEAALNSHTALLAACTLAVTARRESHDLDDDPVVTVLSEAVSVATGGGGLSVPQFITAHAALVAVVKRYLTYDSFDDSITQEARSALDLAGVAW